jgi:histone H3/H4
VEKDFYFSNKNKDNFAMSQVAKTKTKRVKKPLDERVFPTSRLKLLCVKSIVLEDQTVKVKRVEPEALALLRTECKRITDEMIKASAAVMNLYKRSFAPSIVQYILKSMGIKIYGSAEKKDLFFPRSVFHKYVASKLGGKRVSAAASDALQYAVESKIDALIKTALLFVVVSGKLIFKKEDVVAAMIAKQQCHEMFRSEKSLSFGIRGSSVSGTKSNSKK